jgi:hypothetical protein
LVRWQSWHPRKTQWRPGLIFILIASRLVQWQSWRVIFFQSPPWHNWSGSDAHFYPTAGLLWFW